VFAISSATTPLFSAKNVIRPKIPPTNGRRDPSVPRRAVDLGHGAVVVDPVGLGEPEQEADHGEERLHGEPLARVPQHLVDAHREALAAVQEGHHLGLVLRRPVGGPVQADDVGQDQRSAPDRERDPRGLRRTPVRADDGPVMLLEACLELAVALLGRPVYGSPPSFSSF
jgi:hypothetical protein